MLDAIAVLQTAVNNCLTASSPANQSALSSAGISLQQAATTVRNNQPTSPAITSSVTSPAITAGQKAQSSTRCSRINAGTSTSVQTNLASANTALSSINVTTPEDPSMQIAWPTGCFGAGTYWDDWKELVLYQVSDNYRPLSAAASCGATCLSISGSGNPNVGSGGYRASVILAGKRIGSQTRPSVAVSDYLELNNQTGKTATPTNLTFVTYKPSDTANYSNVNDLALCLDGNNNCK